MTHSAEAVKSHDSASSTPTLYTAERRRLKEQVSTAHLRHGIGNATEDQISRAINGEVERLMLRQAASQLHPDAEFDVMVTYRYPLEHPVTAINAEVTLNECRRRCMKESYGRRWWEVIPRVGFPVLAVLEDAAIMAAHIHALFTLDAAGNRSKSDAVARFRDKTDQIWRSLVAGGSAWIEPMRSSNDARRYATKKIGTAQATLLVI